MQRDSHQGSSQSEGSSSTKEADKVKAWDTNKKTPHRTGCFFTEEQTWLTSKTVYSQNSSAPSQTLWRIFSLKPLLLLGSQSWLVICPPWFSGNKEISRSHNHSYEGFCLSFFNSLPMQIVMGLSDFLCQKG